MTDTLFSIVIPTYNREVEIKRCLESVINQTYTNWEAIVVDNYSEDKTEEVVASFNDERIHYFKNHNYGVISVSRNFALDRAKGDWVCFLDSDDAWMPEKLETVLQYIDAYDLVYHGFKANIKKTRLFQQTEWLFYTVKENTLQYVLMRGDPFSPSCSAVRRDFIGNVRFDESKDLFAIEDYDFFLQLMLKRPRIMHVKKSLTYYDVSSGVSHNQEKHLARLRLIYQKYRSYLSEAEYQDVMKSYAWTQGCGYYPENLKEARKYFRIAATSTAREIKRKAMYAVFKTYILQMYYSIRRVKR